ncbi:MAG: leucine-rich repeat domain-containing protein [Planctomycetota bacterium]|jgi:hypothetical protein
MKPNIFAVLSEAIILCFVLTGTAWAEDYTWTDNGDGTCTITNYTGLGGDVTIPDTLNGLTVTSIGSLAFYENTSLTSVTIPWSITFMGDLAYAFKGCVNLTVINVESSNSAYSSINGVLFNKNQTALIKHPEGKAGDYTVPASVVSIGDYAFVNCLNLTSVTIPDNTTSIGSVAFGFCAGLTDISIGNSVTNIGNSAFNSCSSLTSIFIPSSVSSIGWYVFHRCYSLQTIEVEESNPVYSSLDGILFNKSQTELIKCPGGKAGNYTIPTSVISIETEAFEACASLTGIIIPDSVTSIGNSAFQNCSDLTSVTIGKSVTSIGDL